MIYIYLKTHNITGLKYLGKTIKNPNGMFTTNQDIIIGRYIILEVNKTTIKIEIEDRSEFISLI